MNNVCTVNYVLTTKVYVNRTKSLIRLPDRLFYSLSAAQKAIQESCNSLRMCHKMEPAVVIPLPTFLRLDLDDSCYEWNIIPAAPEDALLTTPEEPPKASPMKATPSTSEHPARRALKTIRDVCYGQPCHGCPIEDVCREYHLSNTGAPSMWEI